MKALGLIEREVQQYHFRPTDKGARRLVINRSTRLLYRSSSIPKASGT